MTRDDVADGQRADASDGQEISVQRLERAADIAAAQQLRRVVFCAEQGVSEDAEIDGRDPDAVHLGARVGVNGELVGTCRLLADGDGLHVQRVAVLAQHRRSGVGAALMRGAEHQARAAGASELSLHAQLQSRGFYERLGYRGHGEGFIEEGIPHVAMRKSLR